MTNNHRHKKTAYYFKQHCVLRFGYAQPDIFTTLNVTFLHHRIETLLPLKQQSPPLGQRRGCCFIIQRLSTLGVGKNYCLINRVVAVAFSVLIVTIYIPAV